jgi:geranylgeranyl diphosphate synthase type II
MDTKAEKQMLDVDPANRILLLPHCLRCADTCQGKYTKYGLECQECNPDCSVNHLRRAALDAGYKGVCVAPGGVLALKYVKENKPLGIVAVACDKELEEGIQGVNRLSLSPRERIPIVVIPLSKDGCVNTEVDMKLALEKISLGCVVPAGSAERL